jgi:prepilin-type N-terminal cleavage/methylation domain-containing protein
VGFRGVLPCGSKGMTFIEVILVVAVLSAVLLISFPRIPYLSDYSLKSDARKLAGLFSILDESATTKKTYYKVLISPGAKRPGANRITVESSKTGREFKAVEDSSLSGVELDKRTIVEDIFVAGLGLVDEGEVDLFFNPLYGAEPFSLHIGQSGSVFTINYNPYSGRVKVVEGRI